MKRFFTVMICLLTFSISACSNQAAPAATQTPEPTITLMPTKIDAPTPTPKLNFQGIRLGEIFWRWGMQIIGSNAPYLLWGAHLRDIMNGSCQGFICAGKDLRLYDPNVWQFLGEGKYGKETFIFTEPLDTFVITFPYRIGFDSFSGKTIDGKEVTYGYLTDGTITTSTIHI